MLRLCNGRAICGFLIIACSILLLIDWGSVFGWFTPDDRQNTINKKQELKIGNPLQKDDPSRRFLYRQYETAVQEIQNRLNQENLLFGLKFTLVGGVLALFFSYRLKGRDESKLDNLRGSPLAACFFWAAVITSSIVDCRILFNADFIVTIGTWINHVVEPAMLDDHKMGWEQFVSTSKLIKSGAYPFLRFNAHLLTLLLFISTFLLFFINVPKKTKDEVRRVNVIGCAASLVVFGLAGLHYHYSKHIWWLYCAGITAVGIVSIICYSSLISCQATINDKK